VASTSQLAGELRTLFLRVGRLGDMAPSIKRRERLLAAYRPGHGSVNSCYCRLQVTNMKLTEAGLWENELMRTSPPKIRHTF